MNPTDNIFRLFQGEPGQGPRREGRRRFPVGPSQIGNLPGNFPMPSASPSSATPQRREWHFSPELSRRRSREDDASRAALTPRSPTLQHTRTPGCWSSRRRIPRAGPVQRRRGGAPARRSPPAPPDGRDEPPPQRGTGTRQSRRRTSQARRAPRRSPTPRRRRTRRARPRNAPRRARTRPRPRATPTRLPRHAPRFERRRPPPLARRPRRPRRPRRSRR